MQTLSKAWGLAALRLGLAYASMDIIDLYNKTKPPYNVNEASQQLALKALLNTAQVNDWIKEVILEREKLVQALNGLSFIEKIYPSDANFFLMKVNDADKIYTYLTDNEIVVRNRTKDVLCENCLRVTVGTPKENEILIETLKKYKG